MPRPPKKRNIDFLPDLTYFKPAGVPLKNLREVSLGFEELEAIRLKDLEGLEQEACAVRMGISRPTFHRIIVLARQKLARALIEGKAIRIEGGNYHLSQSLLHCFKCDFTGRAVDPEKETPGKCRGEHPGEQKDCCPRCGSDNVKFAAQKHASPRDAQAPPRRVRKSPPQKHVPDESNDK